MPLGLTDVSTSRSARIVRLRMQRKGPVNHDWAIVGKQESKTRAISGEEAVNMMVICVPVCSWIVERTPDAGGAFGRLRTSILCCVSRWR